MLVSRTTANSGVQEPVKVPESTDGVGFGPKRALDVGRQQGASLDTQCESSQSKHRVQHAIVVYVPLRGIEVNRTVQ